MKTEFENKEGQLDDAGTILQLRDKVFENWIEMKWLNEAKWNDMNEAIMIPSMNSLNEAVDLERELNGTEGVCRSVNL
jgi:hypothetical protein